MGTPLDSGQQLKAPQLSGLPVKALKITAPPCPPVLGATQPELQHLVKTGPGACAAAHVPCLPRNSGSLHSPTQPHWQRRCSLCLLIRVCVRVRVHVCVRVRVRVRVHVCMCVCRQ